MHWGDVLNFVYSFIYQISINFVLLQIMNFHTCQLIDFN